MIDRLGRFGVVLLATILIWASTFAVWTIMPSGFVTDLAVLTAFGSSVALWMVLAFHTIDHPAQPKAERSEKAKRKGDEDARLALLLQMMDDDERRALKRRLADQLGGDGEMIPLADLLADEQRARRRS